MKPKTQADRIIEQLSQRIANLIVENAILADMVQELQKEQEK